MHHVQVQMLAATERIMRKLLIIIFLIISNQSFAGWYQCYSYKGQLAGMNIHMYLQLREINSESKDSVMVAGVYKYDKHNTPISLTGYLVDQEILKLSELSNENEVTASLLLKWSEFGNIKGTWTGQLNKKRHVIKLTQIGSLIDTDSDHVNPQTKIMMGSSFKNEYLVGLYDKEKEDYRAKMLELQIIDKKSNELKYRIDFRDHIVPVGNVMTIIFANAYASESPDSISKNIEMMQDDGRMGTELYLTYDLVSDSFIIEK